MNLHSENEEIRFANKWDMLRCARCHQLTTTVISICLLIFPVSASKTFSRWPRDRSLLSREGHAGHIARAVVEGETENLGVRQIAERRLDRAWLIRLDNYDQGVGLTSPQANPFNSGSPTLNSPG
jgi:hypothetical protein